MDFGTFFDGEIAQQERICLASFLQHGHTVTVFSYRDLDLPADIKRADAQAILPRDAFWVIDTGPHAHRGSASQFSDFFRYHMIKKTGLVWIDTDVFCLRSDWPDREFLWAWQGPCLVNGAVLRIPSDHPVLDEAIEAATRVGRLAIWGYTGPFLLTALVQQHELQASVLPTESFYPLHWSEVRTLITPMGDAQKIVWPQQSYSVHLWNEVLRMIGYNKIAGPPAGSPLAELFDRVGLDGAAD